MLRKSLLLVMLIVAGFAGSAKAQNWGTTVHTTSCCDIGISLVVCGSINNASLFNDGVGYYTYYSNLTALMFPGSQQTMRVDLKGVANAAHRIAWIDYNRDGDFNDAGEKVFEVLASQVLSVTQNFTVPANATHGITRMRVRSTFSGSGTLTPTNSISYGDTEDYNVDIQPPVSIDMGQPVEAFAGLAFEGQIPRVGGASPFTYNVTPVLNGEWVKFDIGTGRIYGVPPAELLGQQTLIDVSVTDGTQAMASGQITVNFRTPNALPYTDDFSGANANNYQVNLGTSAYANYLPQGGAVGTGLVLSSNSNGTWPLENTSSPSVVTVLNTPAHWDGGSSPDPRSYQGEAIFQVSTPGLRRIALDFDYKIVNQSTSPSKEYFVNFVVEYAEANGAPQWLRLGGDNPPAISFYRAATAFKPLHVDIPLSGNSPVTGIKIRWLVRNSYNSAQPTYIGIDNLSVTVPAQITNQPILPAGQETAFYGPLDLTIVGGTAPYTITGVAANPIIAGLNFSLTQDGGTGAWSITATGGKGPNIGTAGVHDFDLKLMDSVGGTFQDKYTVSIAPAPPVLTLENTSIPSTARGFFYQTALQATGGLLPYTFSLLNGPSWMTIDSVTGLISADVDASQAFGNYPVTVVLKDRINTTVSRPMVLKVVDTLTIDLAPLPNAQIGRTYSHKLTAGGGSPAYVWSILSGNKPAGVSLDSSSGELFGVPLQGQTGQRSFTVEVRDGGIQVATALLTIDIIAATSNTLQVEPQSTSLGALRAGADFSAALLTFGGEPPYTFSAVNASGLPSGLFLTTDGRIVGSAAIGTEGSYLLKVRIQDALNSSIIVNVSYSVEPEYLFPMITTSTIGTRRVGESLVILLEVSGGIPPFAWSIAPGSALPAGLVLNPNAGSLSGTLLPASLAQTPVGFTLQVTDGLNNVGELIVGGSILPGEYPALDIPNFQTLPIAEAGAGHFSAPLVAAGGVPPYRWQLVGGALPFGLVLSQEGHLNGNIPGTETGTYLFSVRVTDAFNTTDEQTLSITVVPNGSAGTIVTGPAADGLSNLPTEGKSSGCALVAQTNALMILLLVGVSAFALRRRRSEA